MEYSGFGDSNTGDDLVIQFYKEWNNFTTCKSFQWVDPYDERDAEDRYGRRYIHRHNKRER